MKKLLSIVGVIAFWLSWPFFYYYLRGTTRTRVLITDGNKVLVLKSLVGPGKWILPGGGIHKGESAREGIIRELHEETGILLTSNDLDHVGKEKVEVCGIPFVVEQFIAKTDGRPTIVRQKLEIIDSSWLEPSLLNSANVQADVLSLLEVCRGRPNLIK